MVNVKIDINKLNPDHVDFSQTLYELCQRAVVSGAGITYDNAGSVVYAITPGNFPMALGQAVVALGCEVTGMEFFIKVSAPDAQIPVGVPHREYSDENGDEVIRTWSSWKLSNHNFTVLNDNNIYIGANAYNNKVPSLNDFATVFADCIDTMTFTSMLPGE